MQFVLDAMDDASRWSAIGPDGVTPSTELRMDTDAVRFRFGADHHSGSVTASTRALNHTLRRALPGVDLTIFDEIRLSTWCDRGASGAIDQPFFLELRLGSVTVDVNAVNNTWSRLLPLTLAGDWQLIRLSLSDLPLAVRGNATQMQLRCVDASQAFTCFIDDVLAVRDDMIGDVDTALLAELDKRLTLDGQAIPAVFFLAENPTPPPAPYIRLTNYDVQLASERDLRAQSRVDFSTNAFQMSRVSVPYDVYYEVDAFADTRQHQTRILEFILRRFAPQSELIVNGVGLTVEWVPVDPLDLAGRLRNDRPLLHFRVRARQEIGSPVKATPPFHDVNVLVNEQARA